jgi:hypothetical protein
MDDRTDDRQRADPRRLVSRRLEPTARRPRADVGVFGLSARSSRLDGLSGSALVLPMVVA